VLVTEKLKLAASAEQAEALLAAMRACNAAATRAAEVAFQHRTANRIRILSGIRGRITVRTAQRADAHSWAFSQLRRFIAYKAALAGVPVVLVDPRKTSRECPQCGHIDKQNRPSRDVFCCRRCGLAGPADHIAARNISGRAAVMQPYAA
jgi:putative transposase